MRTHRTAQLGHLTDMTVKSTKPKASVRVFIRRASLVLAALVFATIAMTTSAAIPTSERNALLAFYTSTNGATWNTNTGWNGATGTECTWFGISCDGTQSHVTSISLVNNNLTGTLSALTGLTNLGYFDVDTNQLTGTIPALTGVTNLYNFDVDSNQLTGPIPALTGLTNLGYFVVNNNQLSGTIPALMGLTSLASFKVGYNQLSGPVPAPPASLSFASLCPNLLDTTPGPNDAGWDTATGYTPWWATPYANNLCDDIFTDGFGR